MNQEDHEIERGQLDHAPCIMMRAREKMSNFLSEFLEFCHDFGAAIISLKNIFQGWDLHDQILSHFFMNFDRKWAKM